MDSAIVHTYNIRIHLTSRMMKLQLFLKDYTPVIIQRKSVGEGGNEEKGRGNLKAFGTVS